MAQDNGQGTTASTVLGTTTTTTPAATTTATATNTGTTTTTAAADFDWKTNIAPEWHETWQKKGWTNPNDVLKSYGNLENMMGATDRLILPKDDTDTKAWDDVFTKMGRPPAADQYKFDDMPQGMERNADVNKWFQDNAFAAGLSQKQAAAIEKSWNVFGQEFAAKAATAEKQHTEQTMTELKSKWGPKYEDNMNLAKSAAAKLGGEQMAGAIDALADKAGLGPVLEMFAKIGQGMGEANFVMGDSKTQGAGGAMNKESALKEINSLMADPDFLSPNKNPARHKELNEKVTKLFETAYADEPLQKSMGGVKI